MELPLLGKVNTLSGLASKKIVEIMNMQSNDLERYHRILVEMIEAKAKPETAEWFTNYLKGAISYRGVKTPALKGILSEFFNESELDKQPDIVQLNHIRYWLSCPMAEDKLIAILWIKKWLKLRRTKDDATVAVNQIFELLENVFASGDIHDWSTNDWLCVRVLETIPPKHPEFVQRLISWHESTSVWQRRSGLLAFKKSAKTGYFHLEIEEIISKLLPSSERFIQTAIGWVLSDAARKHPDWAARLFDLHFEELSHEVITRHTKHLPSHVELKEKSRKRRRRN